jgi:uncharacterized protein YegL
VNSAPVVAAPNQAVIMPIILLVDLSNSMNQRIVLESAGGEGRGRDASPRRTRLDHLLEALDRLPQELRAVGDARRGGELAMVTFGGEGVEEVDLRPEPERTGPAPTFVRLVDAEIPKRLAGLGHTPLAQALDVAVEIVRRRNRELARQPRYRANVWLITDGQNTDAETGYPAPIPESTIASLRQLERESLALFFTAVLPGGDQREIERVTPESSYRIEEADFGSITQLVSVSSRSIAGHLESAEALYARMKERMKDIFSP